MKKYHLFFLLLKILVIGQFVLILVNKNLVNPKIYLITEIVFKISLGLFMDIFLFHAKLDCVDFEDKVIFSFAGGLLIYDAVVNDMPRLLEEYGINVSDRYFQIHPIHAGSQGAQSQEQSQ